MPFFYQAQQLAVAGMAESLVELAIGDIVLVGVVVDRDWPEQAFEGAKNIFIIFSILPCSSVQDSMAGS